MFSSSFLKIERANQHIVQLESTFRAFVKNNPHRISIQPDVEAGKVKIGVDFGVPLPSLISMITGDAVHNLRTALDHLACALVAANGGTIGSYIGFPFHEDRANFEANLERKIKGASKEAVDLIKSLEPYPGGNGQPLWRLNKLDIADKHHSLILAARITALPKIIVRNPDGSVMVTMENCRVGGDGRVNMIAVPADRTFEIEHQDQTPISILFRETDVLEGKDVIESLEKLSEIVFRTLQIFEARKNLFGP